MFVWLEKAEAPLESGTMLAGPDGIDVASRDQSPKVDEAILFPRY